MPHPPLTTVGQLQQAGYRHRTVKQELRENLIAHLQSGREVIPGVIGYGSTVLPQIIHAILSRHDMLFLGLRGQAKTRILRALPDLLDEWIPVLTDLEIPDDPVAPTTTLGKRLVEAQGDEAAIRWLHRSERYHEKLATPDVTIADLIGEIDIVKHAEGRYLSDESTMHFGLIPRTNRGIFAINELPDLAPRIQVGLFNVLEERDVQVRGYPVRLNLDVCLVFSANPEDYTNRGRIVTPLKDRIGSVIRTHYPRTIDEGIAITKANAWLERTAGSAGGHIRSDVLDSGSPPVRAPAPLPVANGIPVVDIPPFMHRIVEESVRLARQSPHINQASGVSVRTSMACMENVVSSAERRGILTHEPRVVPRICDLAHVLASCRGKIELMLAEDGQGSEDKLVVSLVGEGVKAVFEDVASPDGFETVVDQFQGGLTLTLSDDMPAADVVASLKQVKGLVPAAAGLAKSLGLNGKDEQDLAAAGEFLLEALYVNNRLSKHVTATGVGYGR